MLKNFKKLLSANLLAGVLGVISLTVISRSLGPSQYGLVAVVVSLGAFIEHLASFQAWQAVTKYAAEASRDKDTNKLWSVISAGFYLDAIGSVLGSLAGILVVLVFHEILDLSDQYSGLFVIYMISIAFNCTGTATAVMRIYERYDWIVRVIMSMALVKVMLVAIFAYYGLSIGGAIYLLAAINVIQSLIFLALLFYLGTRETGKNFLSYFSWGVMKNLKGFLRFVVSTHLGSSVRQFVNEFDVVLLSSMVGSSDAGQYKLAKQYGAVLLRLVEPGQQVIFPRVAEFVANSDYRSLANLIRKLFISGAAFSLIVCIGFFLVGDQVLDLILGQNFHLVADYMKVFLVALSIYLSLFFVRPIVLSFGRADSILAIYVLATISFFVIFQLLFQEFGGIAMMWAQVAFYFTWAAGMLLVIKLSWPKRYLTQP